MCRKIKVRELKTDGIAVGFEGPPYDITYFGGLTAGFCTVLDLLQM
jgi:hypothetical protein